VILINNDLIMMVFLSVTTASNTTTATMN